MRWATRRGSIYPAAKPVIWMGPMYFLQMPVQKSILPDEGYDADVQVLEPLARAGKTAVTPPRRHRTNKRVYDKHRYQARHLIEDFFNKLKQLRAIATRYDKTARNFLAAIHLAAAILWRA